MSAEVENFGVACRSHHIQNHEFLSDGRLALISYSSRGAQLILVDGDSHEVQTYNPPRGIASWGMSQAPDSEIVTVEVVHSGKLF